MGKLKAGTFIMREMAESRAYWSLSGTACAMLTRFLMFRDMDNKHNCLNKNDLYMPYKSLENLFGSSVSGEAKGIARATIARALTDLMAKGFIKIIHQGGAYQRDRTIYGLTDDWKYWNKGDVIRTKPKGIRASSSTFKAKPALVTGTIPTPSKPELKRVV